MDGFIKDAFSGKKLANVKVKNNNTQISLLSTLSGFYSLHTPDGNNPLDYDRDGYNHLKINDFVINTNDLFPQNAVFLV